MRKPELISPAGTLEKLKTAFEFGADAVYAGVPEFSLRSRINDFTYLKMKQGIEYAHQKRKRVYATLNIYAHNRHLVKAADAIKKYKNIGADGLIISDPGILSVAKKTAPKINIHLSTQANCANYEAAKFWQTMGVKRIVLAREASLKEIAEIHKKAPKMELEYFVHGAMCMSYSGRCILSKWLSGRSANLGECSQPCRWEYNVSVAEENGKELVLDEDRNGAYIFNSKDLCLIEYLDKLFKAGVSSFKIEGRTKSAYYVAATAKLYREAIDNLNFKKYLPPKGWKEEIKKIANRGYTTGFLFGEEKCEHNFCASHEKCEWQFVGEILEKPSAAKLGRDNKTDDNREPPNYIKIHNALYSGDNVEFVPPQGKIIKIKVNKIYDAKIGKEQKSAHGGQGQIAVIFSTKNIPAGSMARRKAI